MKAENIELLPTQQGLALGPVDIMLHGTGGPLSVSIRDPLNLCAISFVQAATKLGFAISDYNNGDQDNSVSLFQQTVHNGQRCGTDFAYLKPASERTNLQVVTRCQVVKILLNSDTGSTTATGVEVLNLENGRTKPIQALKEVIVSAGAIGSPHLLQLSGIGPREDLENAGVKCIVDLKDVGRNLEDHLATAVRFNAKRNQDIGSVNGQKAEAFPQGLLALVNWACYGKGKSKYTAYADRLYLFRANLKPFNIQEFLHHLLMTQHYSAR